MSIDLVSQLSSFIGTENYYKDPNFPKINYTDGVKFVFDNVIKADSLFLKYLKKVGILNLINKHIDLPFLCVILEPQVEGCKLVLTDGDSVLLKEYQLKDMIVSVQVKMYLIDGVLLLVSEY